MTSMAEQQTEVPVRKSITVKADAAHAIMVLECMQYSLF